MITDRELLELAAKAAGVDLYGMSYMKGNYFYGNNRSFEPLTDDGSALRLGVKLGIWIGHHEDGVTTSDTYSRFDGAIEEDYGSDPYAATRRCIVRAAAAIGEKMP